LGQRRSLPTSRRSGARALRSASLGWRPLSPSARHAEALRRGINTRNPLAFCVGRPRGSTSSLLALYMHTLLVIAATWPWLAHRLAARGGGGGGGAAPSTSKSCTASSDGGARRDAQHTTREASRPCTRRLLIKSVPRSTPGCAPESTSVYGDIGEVDRQSSSVAATRRPGGGLLLLAGTAGLIGVDLSEVGRPRSPQGPRGGILLMRAKGGLGDRAPPRAGWAFI
jgi:hypothetical protein